MSLIKGLFIKSTLNTLTDGNHGSTILGTLAAGLLANNIDWSKVTNGFKDQNSAIECGKVIGIVILLLWGYFTGKGNFLPKEKKDTE